MDGKQQSTARAIWSALRGDAQHKRLMRLEFPRNDGPQTAKLLPNILKAHEEVSRGFRFDIEVLSDDAQIPLKMIMARMVTISLVRSDGSLRYFNGYVTEFRFLRADGGFAFYQMILEPWLSFTRLRQDSVSFHNKTVREITEVTLQNYRQADWCMHSFEDDPRLTVANQYNETDFNHLHRRWEARGLHYWYEHRYDGHTLMLSDHSHLCEPIDATRHYDADVIPFRAKAGSLEDDGIREWTAIRRLGSGTMTLGSFDYKNPRAQHVSFESANQQGDFFPYEVFENVGYGFRTRLDGEKLAQKRMVERDKDSQNFEAEGNDRTVQPGRTFKLGDHFSAECRSTQYDPEPRLSIGDRSYLILTVDHEATNNYQAGMSAPSHYTNRFTCSRRDVRWRPGMYFNSVPCNHPGVQTAVVVGPPGSEIHTDGQGRVKVQFHWDRKGNYDENSSPWIRVMTPAGGREFGQIRLPRVKEEVVIVYADGNIDHPLILGAVHNVINMPPWALPSQEALSGMCSRELGGGARGNRLIVDDTRDKIQAQLQSDHQCSQLSLGHIVRIEGNAGRQDLRGEGWELRTDAHGVARAAKGLLLTTESRPAARGAIKDMDESLRRLVAAGEQHQALADLAQTNGAQDAANNQGDVAATLRSQNEAIKGAPVGKGAPSELAEPYLVIASPAGIVSTTAQSTHLASDLNTAVTAGKSVSISAGESFFASIRQSFQLYVQKAGLRLFAAAGDIDIKALTDNINLLSKLNITQTANRILINARQDIVINGGGSYVKLSETGIELGTSGTLVAHATTHEFAGANSMATPDLNTHIVDVAIKRDLVLEYVDADGNPLQHDPIQSHSWDGSVHDNILDESGKTTLTNISRGSFRSEQIKRK